MSLQSVCLPLFIEVALIFVLLGLMAQSRNAAFKAGLRPRDVALGSEAYPAKARQFANAYANQFEMPVLFFVAVVLGLVVHRAGTLFVILEWVFVAARIGQAFVHTTSNTVPLRGGFFLASACSTALLWVLLALGVLVGAP